MDHYRALLAGVQGHLILVDGAIDELEKRFTDEPRGAYAEEGGGPLEREGQMAPEPPTAPLPDPAPQPDTSAQTPMEERIAVVHADIPEQIRKLADLRDAQILTEEEFVTKKTRLLARM